MNGNGAPVDVYLNVYGGNDSGGTMGELSAYDYVGDQPYMVVEDTADLAAVPIPGYVSSGDIAASAQRILDEHGDSPSASSLRIVQEHSAAVGEDPNLTASSGTPDYSRVSDLLGIVREVTNAAVDITGNVARIVPGLRPALQRVGVVIPGTTRTNTTQATPSWQGLIVPGLLVAGAFMLLRGRK